MEGLLLALWALEERPLLGCACFHVLREQGHGAPRSSRDLQVVPWFVRHVEGNGFARERVAIPIGELEVVVAPDETRPIVDTGPCGLAYPVGGLPPPALQVVGVVDLDLADGGEEGVERFRNIAGSIPAVVKPPFLLPVLRCECAGQRWNRLWKFVAGERGDVVVREHTVVDSQLVDVSAAVVVVGAFHACWGDEPGVRAELVQGSVEHSGCGLLAGELAVHVEANSTSLVPRE